MGTMINISEISDKVGSKYKAVIIAAKRAKQLALMAQRAAIPEGDMDKMKSRPDLKDVAPLSDSTRKALGAHKPILVALDEMNENLIEWTDGSLEKED